MSTELPQSLADRAFLIAYDVEKEKLTNSNHNRMVQAALLQELLDAGLLADEKGRARATGGRTGDPVRDSVLDRIADSKPRKWHHWIDRKAGVTYSTVRERLAAARVIETEDRKVLGLFPTVRVTVRDTRVVRELVARVRRVVLDGTPADRYDPRDVALVPLVAAVELNTVFSGRERRAHRDRIKTFAGPVSRDLRRTIEASQAATTAAVT